MIIHARTPVDRERAMGLTMQLYTGCSINHQTDDTGCSIPHIQQLYTGCSINHQTDDTGCSIPHIQQLYTGCSINHQTHDTGCSIPHIQQMDYAGLCHGIVYIIMAPMMIWFFATSNPYEDDRLLRTNNGSFTSDVCLRCICHIVLASNSSIITFMWSSETRTIH